MATTAVLALSLVVTGVAGTAAPPAAAAEASFALEGLALTPPMGFNNWNAFGCNVS